MMDAIKLFLFFVDVFFVIYLIGYSTFLFLSVVVGASELYEKRMDEKMKGTPVSYTHLDVYKRQVLSRIEG